MGKYERVLKNPDEEGWELETIGMDSMSITFDVLTSSLTVCKLRGVTKSR